MADKDAEFTRFQREDHEKAKKDVREIEKKTAEEIIHEMELEHDLRKAGMDEIQIGTILKKEKAIDSNRPTYTRMSRRHLSIETLNRYKIDYEFDTVSFPFLGLVKKTKETKHLRTKLSDYRIEIMF